MSQGTGRNPHGDWQFPHECEFDTRTVLLQVKAALPTRRARMLALNAGRRADHQEMLGPTIDPRRTGRNPEWSNERLRPVMVIGELDDTAIPHIARGRCK